MEQLKLNSENKFNGNFDFTDSVYINNKTEITLCCKKHNKLINIIPKKHLGQKFGGCKKCQKEKCKIILQDGEILKDVNIEKYRDLYFISNFGRVFSKKTNRELKPRLFEYQFAQLIKDGKLSQKLIHILVYITFGKDYDKNKQIDHINGDKMNNKIDNLRCVSPSDNMKNAFKNNDRMHKNHTIQAFNKNGEFVKEFNNKKDAAKFIGHVNQNCISKCLQGKRKIAGSYIWKYKDDDYAQEVKNMYSIKQDENFICLGQIGGRDFSKYFINKEGIIILKNRKLKGTKEIYKRVHLTCSLSKPATFRIHRLIGKFFLKDGEKYFYDENFVVNHKDKNKHNNHIDNLEWISQHQNIIHGNGKKVAKISKETNEVIEEFDSITNALKSLNLISKSHCITDVCEGKQNFAYGFKWKYI
jgi:HNH endonuclease/NUMOD1 domain